MKVGLLVGMEDTFPRAVSERIQKLDPKIEVDLPRLAGTRPDDDQGYSVIMDRISHEVAYYRSHLKVAALRGVRVVNDPFLTSSDDRFVDAVFAGRLGVKVPRTVLLPQKAYPETVGGGSLRNLAWPIPFGEHLEAVGTPATLRPVGLSGFRHRTLVHDQGELMAAYDRSGTATLMLQEVVPWSRYVRCIVIGGDQVIVTRFDPEYRQYLNDPDYLEPDLEARVVDGAARIAGTLGYGACAIEFAIVESEPYAVEFINPVPDFERSTLTPFFFEKVVEASAQYLVSLAKMGRRDPSEVIPSTSGLTALVTAPPKSKGAGQAKSKSRGAEAATGSGKGPKTGSASPKARGSSPKGAARPSTPRKKAP